MSRVADNRELFEQLKDGGTVVVPDAAFAANLKQQFSNWVAQSSPVWTSPLIFSWQDWLEHIWSRQRLTIQDTRIVLNDLQQRILWKRVIESDVDTHKESVLWNLNASISQARKAWALCHEHCLDLSGERYVVNDVKVFRRWMQAYEQQLRRNDWLDPQLLAQTLISSAMKIPGGRLRFFGFVRFSPLQSRFISEMLDQHVEECKDSSIGAADLQVFEFADIDAELSDCANWARSLYESDSDIKIGILVANLRQHANKVDSVFKSVFVPDYALSPDETDVFSRVQHNRLIDQGLIHSALNTLSLMAHRFSYEQFSAFLRDKFITRDESQKQGYCILDVRLRKRLAGDLNLSDAANLLKHAQVQDGINVAALIHQLQSLDALRTQLDRSATIMEWCDHFSAALKLLDWPDSALLDPVDKELYRLWDQLFANVCTAGLVYRKISVVDALSLFNDTASVTSFRIKPARITIADINDVGGMSFDAAWVCGLNDTALPRPVSLSPLLPFTLQRERQLPYATSDDCQYRADFQFGQLMAIAGEIRFSYYLNDEHNSYRASNYLSRFTATEVPADLQPSDKQPGLTRLESYHDDCGIPFVQKKMPGGSYLLKSQAQCPFKAYAEKRLNVEPVDRRDHGIDAAERGSLVHRLLHSVWNNLKTRSALISLTDDALETLISREVDKVVASLGQAQRLFADVEARRLKRLAQDWLKLEKSRTKDFSVFALESPSKFTCQGLEIDLKVDRIDKIEDGPLLVIDYKTGQSTKSLWLGKRLQDPQIPVYCLALGDEVGAVCFANTKDIEFDGVSETDIAIKGVQQVGKSNQGKLAQFENWQQLRRHWSESIETLAHEVKDGHASVTPESSGVCKFCGRQPLCRINQHQSPLNRDDD